MLYFFYYDFFILSKYKIEKNNEFLDFIFQKKSIKDYTQNEIGLIFLHINSYNRKSKDNRTPYEIIEFIYGNTILEKFNIIKIDFNKINLTRNRIINYRNVILIFTINN